MKIRLVGAELSHADGEMDKHEKLSGFFAILRTQLKVERVSLSTSNRPLECHVLP